MMKSSDVALFPTLTPDVFASSYGTGTYVGGGVSWGGAELVRVLQPVNRGRQSSPLSLNGCFTVALLSCRHCR